MRPSAAAFSRQSPVLSQNILAVEANAFMLAILKKKSLVLFFVGFCFIFEFAALAEEDENDQNVLQTNEDLVECQTLAEAADEICSTDSVVAAANQMTSMGVPGGGSSGTSLDTNSICEEAAKSTAAINSTLASFNHHCSMALSKCLRSCGAARVVDPSEAVELRRNIQACKDSQRSLPYFNQKVSSVIARSPLPLKCQQLRKGQNNGSMNKVGVTETSANKVNGPTEPKNMEAKSSEDEPNQSKMTRFANFDSRPLNQNEKKQGLQSQGRKQDKGSQFLVPELEENNLGGRKLASASKKSPTFHKPTQHDPLLKGSSLVAPPVPPPNRLLSNDDSLLGQTQRVFKKIAAFLTGEPYPEVMDEAQLSSSSMSLGRPKQNNQNREILLSVGPDGITAADGPSLFEKVSMRYKVYRPTLITSD